MINLLPPEEKKILLAEENKRIVIVFGISVLIFLFCLSLILLFTKAYITGQVNTQEVISQSEFEKLAEFGIEDFQKRMVLTNKDLQNLKNFYKQKLYLTNLFEKLAKIIPSGIYLTDLTFSKQIKKVVSEEDEEENGEKVKIEKELAFYGFALNRQVLFDFKKNLEQEFKEINFPPSNWVKSENINFYIALKIP